MFPTDRSLTDQIIASLEGMSVLELKDLTTLMLERLAGIRIETEAERELREFREAQMMPFYTLTIVSLNSAEKGIVVMKQLSEILRCSSAEARKIMKSLPYEVVSRIKEYPPYCMEEFRPLKEALEAIGAVMEESYNYGYYA